MIKVAKAESADEVSKLRAGSAGELVVVGKDVLELLSSAMYVDPLSIYREYVQNAADAIDEARSYGLLGDDHQGEVTIMLDADARTVRIRDNGAGIAVADAAARLLSIGASTKRGTAARGFRGVGRLAGLAYCRALTFRTRAAGDIEVLELRWDCQRLKAAFREVGQDDDLPAVLDRIVTFARVPAATNMPPHFFEVELTDVVRHHRRDALLNEDLIADYLSEVAPVPFEEAFSYGADIVAHLSSLVRLGNLQIRVGGCGPLRRPHRDRFPVSEVSQDNFSHLELLSFDGRDGDVSAVGWLLHHSYLGALPDRAGIKGLRLRCGNVQIGETQLVESVFPEPRFNSWTVGEIHVVDRRIVPNARRDHFEQNVHFGDLTAQVEPLARRIARRCRVASVERNRARAAQVNTAGLAGELKADGAAVLLNPKVAAQLDACVGALSALAREFVPPGHREPLLTAVEGLQATLQELGHQDPKTYFAALLKRLVQSGALTSEDVTEMVLQTENGRH